MYCKNSSKTGPLPGVDRKETSWRSYSKSLIVELKEKIADRRARTLALLSENQDLTAFKEIDTESDGLDDTSTNNTNVQELPEKEDTTPQEHSGEMNSISEASSLTESDYNDVDIRRDEFKQSPDISNAGNSRCCSRSCSTITSVSGGSYTSEDVSSRSLDDFVADDGIKDGNYPCPHSVDVKCSLCLIETKMQEKYLTANNEYVQDYDNFHQEFEERSVTKTPSKASIHLQHYTAGHTNPPSSHSLKVAKLVKVKSDTYLYPSLYPGRAYVNQHNSTAGLLMTSLITGIQTHNTCLESSKPSSDEGSFSHQEPVDTDITLNDMIVEEKTNASMNSQTVSGNLITELHEIDDSNNLCRFLDEEEYYYLEEEVVTGDIDAIEDEEGDNEELEMGEKTNETEEENEGEIHADEEKKEKQNKEAEEEKGNSSGIEERTDKEEEEREIVDTKITEEEDVKEIGGEMEEETERPTEQKGLSQMGNIEHALPTEDYITLEGKSKQTAQAEERMSPEDNLISNVCDSNESETSSRIEKLQDQTYSTLRIHETGHKSLSHLKDMLDEMIQIFESNVDIYNAVDKSIVAMFENHSADFSMLISAYKNRSGNSGYAQTRKHNAGAADALPRQINSTRTETAVKLNDQNRSLQTCLEKARLATTLQGKVGRMRNRAENFAAVKAYEQTVAELEKTLLDYLEVYAKEATADGSDNHSHLTQISDISIENTQEVSQEKGHNALRRSDTFVVKDTFAGKPPNIAKRKTSGATLTKILSVNPKNKNRGVVQDSDGVSSEDFLKAPHSSPTFLVTENFWNVSPTLLDTTESGQEPETNYPDGHKDIDHASKNQQELIRSASYHVSDHDFGSDSSESLSEVKETVKLTYTSSLLAQLLDYNSAEECRPIKGKSHFGQEEEDTKTRFDNSLSVCSQILNDHVKRNVMCTAGPSRNVEDNQFFRQTRARSSLNKQVSLSTNEVDKFEKYNPQMYDQISDLTVDDGDQERDTIRVASVGGLETSHNSVLNDTINFKNLSEKSLHRDHVNQVLKEARDVDLKTSADDTSKSKDIFNSSQEIENKQSSSSSPIGQPINRPRHDEELHKVKETICSSVCALTNTRDTSPLEKAQPVENIDQSTISSDISGSHTKHYLLGQARQHSHKRRKLSSGVGEDTWQDLCPDKFVSKIDWSSSDEEVVDDLQRDSSPSDLLKQKQKKDVEEKLQQLNKYSDRRRKSRSPLRQRASRDIPSWMQKDSSYQKVNITTDLSSLTGNEQDTLFIELESFFDSHNTLPKQHKYASQPGDCGADDSIFYNVQEDTEIATLLSASQLLLARNQEEKDTIAKHDDSKRLNETAHDSDTRYPKSATISDSAIEEAHQSKINSGQFIKTCEPGYLETAAQQKHLKRYAPNTSTKCELGASDSRNSVNGKSNENIDKAAFDSSNVVDLIQVEVLEAQGEALFSDSCAETCIPVRSIIKKSPSPECLSASSDAAFVIADKSDTAVVNQNSVELLRGKSSDVEPNIYVDKYCTDQNMTLNENLVRLDDKNITESTPQDSLILLATSNGRAVHSSTSEDQNYEKHARLQEGTHQIDCPPSTDLAGDAVSIGVCGDSSDLVSHQVKQEKAYSHLFYTHIKQASSESNEAVKVERDEHDDVETPQTRDNINHIKLYEKQSGSLESLANSSKKQTTATKSTVSCKKRDSKKSIHELTYPCPSLSIKTQNDDFGDTFAVKNFLPFKQMNIKEHRRSTLQKETPFYTISGNDMMDYRIHSQFKRNEPQGGAVVRAEYQAIDALRHKVNRLEQMLQNSDILKNRFQQRMCQPNKDAPPISSRKSSSCPRCQQGVLGQNLVEPCYSISELEHTVNPCFHDEHTSERKRERSRDLNLSADSLCEHCSRLHGTNFTNSTGMKKLDKLSTKECQTSDAWSAYNLKPEKGTRVDGWTQCERSDETTSTLSKLLDDKLNILHQDLREMKHVEDCASKLMMGLDERITRLAEHTSTALVNHSKQLKNSETLISEELKNIHASLQAHSDETRSVREYLNVIGQTSETILHSLKPQQLDDITRSFQTVEENLYPLQESLLIQKKDIEEIRSGLDRVVLGLEDRRLEQTKKGMSNDTMKERIVELTSQRDAEKVFHRITRQSLRALERDHDRLREEYVRATSRRYNTADSEVHKRMWYFLNNQDRCQHCSNRYNNMRGMPSSSDECSSPLCREEDCSKYSRQEACDRPHSHCDIPRSDMNFHKIPYCCCTFDDVKRSEFASCEHDRTKVKAKDISKSKNKKKINMSQAGQLRESRDRILLSDHSHNVVADDVRKSSSTSKHVNIAGLLEADVRQSPTPKEIISCHTKHSRDETLRNETLHMPTADSYSTRDVHIHIDDPSVVCPYTFSCTTDIKETI